MPGNNYAGCGCCSCASFKVKVKGTCTATPIAGASVTIDGHTETTNSSGEATFTSAKKGSPISVTATGFNNGSSTVPSNCAEPTVTLSLASGYTCCGGECPLPSTITGTDANDSFTMTRTTSFGGHTIYCGGYTIVATMLDPMLCAPVETTGDVPVLYVLDCTDKVLYFIGTAARYGCPFCVRVYWGGTVSGCTVTLTPGPGTDTCPGGESYTFSNCLGSGGLAGAMGTWCPLNLTIPLGLGSYDCGISGVNVFLGGSTLTLTP